MLAVAISRIKRRGGVTLRDAKPLIAAYASLLQEPEPCPICGKEFTPSRLHRTLCSQECAKESSRRSSARAQLKFKNSL